MATKKKASRERSAGEESGNARYPRHSVIKALRIPQAILEQGAGKPATADQAAGYCKVGNSGPFRVEISSGLKYGFLTRQDDGLIRPTDLAKSALRPQRDGDALRAYRSALLAAPQVSDVYKHYRGENLPDLQFLKNTVVDTYKVPADKFDEFHQIFVESLRDAQLLQAHGDKTRILDVSEDAPGTDITSDEPSALAKKLGRTVKIDAADTCFVVQPFAAPYGTYYDKVFRPAIEKAGLTPVRADNDIFGTGKIIDQVWRGITAARVLVAELTTRNPNVFYELGLAHALKKPVVLVSATEDDVPFDLQHIRVIYYDRNDPFWGQKLVDKISENILSAIKNPEEAIFRSEGAA
jgi:hypothetical protein